MVLKYFYRRISGRLAARAVVEGKGDYVKRKLDYNGLVKTPKVNGSILKHKRRVRIRFLRRTLNNLKPFSYRSDFT